MRLPHPARQVARSSQHPSFTPSVMELPNGTPRTTTQPAQLAADRCCCWKSCSSSHGWRHDKKPYLSIQQSSGGKNGISVAHIYLQKSACLLTPSTSVTKSKYQTWNYQHLLSTKQAKRPANGALCSFPLCYNLYEWSNAILGIIRTSMSKWR